MKENLGRCDHGGPRAPARKRKLATVGGVSTAAASASDQKTELVHFPGFKPGAQGEEDKPCCRACSRLLYSVQIVVCHIFYKFKK